MKTYFIAQRALLNALWYPKWEGNPKNRGDLCIHIADSLCYAAEMISIVKQLYSTKS